jgi:hypothetical protein
LQEFKKTKPEKPLNHVNSLQSQKLRDVPYISSYFFYRLFQAFHQRFYGPRQADNKIVTEAFCDNFLGDWTVWTVFFRDVAKGRSGMVLKEVMKEVRISKGGRAY